jgi:hypothetical protein
MLCYGYIGYQFDKKWQSIYGLWCLMSLSVVIGTDCIGSWKSNYHTIMATTAYDWAFMLEDYL